MSLDLFGIIVFFIMIALSSYIKYVVSENGYDGNSFWNRYNSTQDLHSLINKEQDSRKKRNFQILLYTYYASLFLLVAICVAFFSNR